MAAAKGPTRPVVRLTRSVWLSIARVLERRGDEAEAAVATERLTRRKQAHRRRALALYTAAAVLRNEAPE